MLEFVGNLGAVPSCCFAVLCRGPTLDTSGGNRDFWILEGVRAGRVPGTVGEIIVVCTLGGGDLRGVGAPLEIPWAPNGDARVACWAYEWRDHCCTCGMHP
jgi:hypothetical protein